MATNFPGERKKKSPGAKGVTMVGEHKVYRQAQPHGEDGVRFSLTKVAEKIAEGRIHPMVRSWTTKTLAKSGNPKGPRHRAKAILDALRTVEGFPKATRWVPDPTASEFIAGAHLTLGDGDSPPLFALGDCFAQGTLLLAEGHELVPVEQIKPGMKVWGLDRWSAVEAVAFKGTLAIDVVGLNNGSELKLTADHHVYVLDCPKHAMLDDGDEPAALAADKHWRDGADNHVAGCTCKKHERVEKRARISELRPGMVLVAPERIPFGAEKRDPDLAWIDGVYAADGWAENTRFAISGKDGCPKEEQKREVERICQARGVATRWHERYISINDADWALRMQQMGGRAPEKHLLSINLDEGAAAASLRGVMADSGKNTRGPGSTFTTTSRLLALQTRLLHRMFGITCGYRYIEDHGGLGKNPIHRLGVRGNSREDGRDGWLLRVKEIQREVTKVPCWDIKTDDHRVYLAEHDVTVSQCDDLTVAFGSAVLAPIMYLAAAESVGANAAVVGHAYGKDKMIEHVLGAIYDEGRWWYADPSVKDVPFGECKPFTRERVYLVPSLELLCDATVCLTDRGPAAGPPPPPRRGDFVSVDGAPGQDEAAVFGGTGRWEAVMDGRDQAPRTLLGFCDLSGNCEEDEAIPTHRRVVPPASPRQDVLNRRAQDAAVEAAQARAEAAQAQQQAQELADWHQEQEAMAAEVEAQATADLVQAAAAEQLACEEACMQAATLAGCCGQDEIGQVVRMAAERAQQAAPQQTAPGLQAQLNQQARYATAAADEASRRAAFSQAKASDQAAQTAAQDQAAAGAAMADAAAQAQQVFAQQVACKQQCAKKNPYKPAPDSTQNAAKNAEEAHQAAVIKATVLANQAQFSMWADAPCQDNPLAWNIVNVPPQTDYAAQELYAPWHDGLEPTSGASWEIKNSAFLPPRKDV